MTYVIIPSSECPRYVPATGWRRLAERLKLRSPRAMIFAGPNNTLYCHPGTVDALVRWLRQQNYQYVLGQPRSKQTKLHAVPNPPTIASAPRGDVH